MLNQKKKMTIEKLDLINGVDVDYVKSRFLGVPDEDAIDYAMGGVNQAIEILDGELEGENTNVDDNPEELVLKAIKHLDESIDLVYDAYSCYGLPLNETLINMDYARSELSVELHELEKGDKNG